MTRGIVCFVAVIAIALSVMFMCREVTADSGEVMWQANGVAICTTTGSQEKPQIVSDGSGGAIITWHDKRNGSHYDIYAQRIDAAANIIWETGGVAICTATGAQEDPQIAPDGSCGAIITWKDSRNGNYDIYAQRIGVGGAVGWTENGVVICTASNQQVAPDIVADGSSGAVITWQDLRNGADNNIYAQRINSSGEQLWAADLGIAVCTAAEDQYQPRIVSDNNGGAIITWYDEQNDTVNYDIYAQRVDANGTVKWAGSGLPLSTAGNIQRNQQIISDGTGGAIVVWEDGRNGNYDIFVQRVNINGTVQWTIPDGKAICTATNAQVNPQITSDGSGGAIISWTDDRNNNYDIFAQRINTEGTVQWQTDGIAVCTATNDQQNSQLVSDGNNGAVFTWCNYRTGSNDIYTQRVNSSGRVQWVTAGTTINAVTANQYAPQLTSDGKGGAIIAWYGAADSSYDISAQRIQGASIWYLSEGSTANGFETWICVQNPNDTDARVKLTYMDDDGNTATEEFTLTAERRFQRMINDIDAMDNKTGVATKVESLNGVSIIAERPMYDINKNGHCSIGTTSPALEWYLAEGSTLGFETWICVQNPGDTSASIRITYMDHQGNTKDETTTVSAQRRYQRRINDVVGMNNKAGVSTKVESLNGIGIIVERPMYRIGSSAAGTARSTSTSAHCSIGVTSPSTVWYLAEGSTYDFDTWICIQNPNDLDAAVQLTYMDEDGDTVVETTTVSAQRRYQRLINNVAGMDNKEGVATMIEATNGIGIIAERAMYQGAKDGHCSIGITSPSTIWYLAEGCTSGYQTWISVQNPSENTAHLRITYMDHQGNVEEETTSVSAHRRYTRQINDVDNMDNKYGVSTKVESINGVGIIVERSMYWGNGKAHCSRGVVY